MFNAFNNHKNVFLLLIIVSLTIFQFPFNGVIKPLFYQRVFVQLLKKVAQKMFSETQ